MPVAGDEWRELRELLTQRGVAGAADLGRFVSNTEFFAAAAFDERAAMPTLIEYLPQATDPKLVSAIAGHLRRPWARPAALRLSRMPSSAALVTHSTGLIPAAITRTRTSVRSARAAARRRRAGYRGHRRYPAVLRAHRQLRQ
jgi:hypothetical protein